MTTDIPMQPKGFVRLRRLLWTFRALLEYRSRLNSDAWLSGSEPWSLAQLWQLAEASAQNQADANDRDGYAWDDPDDAVVAELDCWTE